MRLLYTSTILVSLMLAGCGSRSPDTEDKEMRLPMGRTISLDATRMHRLIRELRNRNVAFWESVQDGKDYISWSPESDESVDASLILLHVNAQLLAEMQKMRKVADLEHEGLTRQPGPAQ